MKLPTMFSNEPLHGSHPLPFPVSPERIPSLFRVTRFTYEQIDHRTCRCEAAIYHDAMSLQVAWEVRQPDIRLHPGVLVRVSWTGRPSSQDGFVRIARLALSEIPMAGFDLFATVPSSWVKTRDLVERARALTSRLSAAQLHLFNAIFWDGLRFHRFLSGPSSINGHHNVQNGNFRHSIEVAERCLAVVADEPRAAKDLLVLAALLHDAGKAEEYTFNRQRRCFEMSERGALVGHRHTILEWIAAALARQRIDLPERQRLGLLHCLTAANGANFLGIRAPASIEAVTLASVDGLSGKADLLMSHAPREAGFGRYHKHLGVRPYVVEGEGAGLMLTAAK